ncbi:MAG TPA: LacI family DNA-binding transcriptional regulator [Terriglobales bacterium]|nr:LacI family DNA-binding transcriptional regulator [Terriglobales bacterium]
MTRKAKLLDIAQALGISTGTVHRALHNHRGVSPMTKARVLQMAKTLHYRPNLAARYLSTRRNLRISINTLQGTTSFWDEVRSGIAEAARSLVMENVELEYRTYPRLGEGEEEAFEAALEAGVNGIITFPSRPQGMHGRMRRASRKGIPVVCVATDAPQTGRLAVVSIDALGSGALAADLMGTFLRGEGRVGVTLSASGITEHTEKYRAFKDTLKRFYPLIETVEPIEDHDVEAEAYEKCRALFESRPDLKGMYVTTEASVPVLRAARDAGILENLKVITTDLFPALIPEICSGAVAATIYQRPRAQGRMAFRILHDFLVEGECPAYQVTLAPHIVMRGNLDYFLQNQTRESSARLGHKAKSAAPVLSEYYS